MMFGPTVFGTNPGQIGPRVIPEFAEVTNDKSLYEKIPAVPVGNWAQGTRHIREWILCCISGKQPSANFSYSGPMTEMIMLGNAALVSKKPIEWDCSKLADSGSYKDNQFIRPDYRRGWSL